MHERGASWREEIRRDCWCWHRMLLQRKSSVESYSTTAQRALSFLSFLSMICCLINMHSFKEANVSANRTPARHCAHGRGVLPFSSLRGSTESKDACVSANKVRADCLLIFILQHPWGIKQHYEIPPHPLPPTSSSNRLSYRLWQIHFSFLRNCGRGWYI